MIKLASLIVLSVAVVALAADDANLDFSSPTATIKSLAKAVNDGDAARAQKCVSTETRLDKALASAGINYVIAVQKLKKSINEKFGEGADKSAADLLGDQAPADFIDQITNDPEAIQEMPNGDDARVKVGEVDLPLKKIDGKWTIAAAELTKEQSAAEKIIATALFTGPAKLMTDLAKEVADGKYKDLDEFKSAFKDRLEVVKKKATSQPAK